MSLRTQIGLIAIVLLVGAATLLITQREGEALYVFGSAALKVSGVMAALWAAWPQLIKLPPYMYGAVAVGALLVLANFRLIVVVVPALVLLYFIKPKPKDSRSR